MSAIAELIYDGDCRFCTRCVRVIAAWDRAGVIRLVPFQAPGAMAAHPELTLEEAREAMQFYDARGRRWAGAEAFREAARLLPAGSPIAFVMGLPGVRQLAGAVYRLIARNRYRLGCNSQSCTRP